MRIMLKDKNLYYIGGVVRDEILGATSFDTDFCYEGDAIKFAHSQELNIVKENPDFGTVRVLVNTTSQPSSIEGVESFIDIASTREEEYPKAGQLPVVKNIGCALKDDLKRRDFTINAMAKNTVSNEIVDYFGGLEDIKAKKLRVLHSKSFIDDPTRIVRGLKFRIRFGFELDDWTRKLQEEYLANVNYDMSYYRLKKELKETFNLNKEEAFQVFWQEGIWKLLGETPPPAPLPQWTEECAKLIHKYQPTHSWIVWLGQFGLEKLELTAEERNIIDLVPNKIPQTDFETYKLFKDLPLESILLYALKFKQEPAVTFLDSLKNITISINGEDLKLLGIPQGRIYKDIFDFVMEEKIKNPEINKLEELNLVKNKYL